MGYKVVLTAQADRDLGEVVRFIAENSVEAAERVGLEIIEVARSLEAFPRRGVMVQARPGLRKLIHRYVLLVYRINEEACVVEILRIWDGRKDPKRFHA